MIFSNVHRPFILRFLSLVVVTLLAFFVTSCSENDDSGSALISCRTCHGKVSKNAFDCPHCGELRPAPVSKQAAAQAVGTAKHAAAQSMVSAVAQAVELYHLEMGLSNVQDDFVLELLLLTPDDGGAPGGPFLRRADDIIDPWGNQFDILVPGNMNDSYDVISWGEDGKPGGQGANADITQ
jgi:general secretion pathway protein G